MSLFGRVAVRTQANNPSSVLQSPEEWSPQSLLVIFPISNCPLFVLSLLVLLALFLVLLLRLQLRETIPAAAPWIRVAFPLGGGPWVRLGWPTQGLTGSSLHFKRFFPTFFRAFSYSWLLTGVVQSMTCRNLL